MEEHNSIMNQDHLMGSDLDHYFDDFNFNQCFSNSECNSSHQNDHLNTPINKSMTSTPNIITNSSPVYQTDEIVINERRAKQLKSNSWESCTTNNSISTAKAASSSFSSKLISFENSNSPPGFTATTHQQHYSTVKLPKNEMDNNIGTSNFPARGVKRVSVTSRSIVNAQDHVLAERKRREKLSQKFIALSAVLPGLKKVLN